MNIVLVSPHFPYNFQNFAFRLREVGANVLGVADLDFGALSPELRGSLSEYYRANNMQWYDDVLRAIGYFTYRHGKIDRIESNNEFWLELDAQLRTDFNVFGIKADQIMKIKRKSAMKQVFIEAGLKPAAGRVCLDEKAIRDFIREVGYPVVAKPDIGVGAAKTYKISNEQDLQHYLNDKWPVDYIVEEFIGAPIVTYDGLTDRDGNVIYASSLRYSQGVMEAVNDDSDIYYYIVRQLESKLEEAGKKCLKAFDVRERFFHFEFFMLENGDIVPMEVNMRPPGGLTLDMYNYVYDFDCYKIWADLLVHNYKPEIGPRKYYVIYVGRKDHIQYSVPFHEVLHEYGQIMVGHERINDVFARALGNHGFLLRAEELPPLLEAAGNIQRRA